MEEARAESNGFIGPLGTKVPDEDIATYVEGIQAARLRYGGEPGL